MAPLTEMRRADPTLTRALLGWLLILLAVSAYTTYRNASHLAETERDLVLEEITDDLEELVSTSYKTDRKIDPDSLSFSVLIRDARDQRYFAIYAASGTLLAGARRLVRVPVGSSGDERAAFATNSLNGKMLRRAVLNGERDELPGFELQVAA